MKGYKDLTTGSPFKNILFFCIPIFIGNIFQQLYSMVDTIIVGQTISLDALAAVGCTGSVNFLILGFISGVCSGFGVLIAQFYGAGDEENVRRSVGTSYVLCIAVTAVVTAVAVATAMPLLKLMRTDSAIIGDAYDYIIVIFWGIGATTLYNMASCMLRAIGDSRAPLYFLIFASVLNIGLDYLCILVFRMGVAGAGVATVLSQLVSGVLCLLYALKKYKILRTRRRHFWTNALFGWKHLKVGLPMALQFSITAIGVMVVQSVLNTMGTDTVAAYTAASKIDSIAQQPFVAIGAAIATYCAQNYGAKQYGRIKKGMNIGLLLTVIFSAAGFLLILLLKKPLILLFAGEDYERIYDNAAMYLYINAGTYLLLGLIFLYRNGIQGMGFSAVTMLAGGAELVMRIVAALIFARYWGYIGVCSANPAAWFGADVILVIVYAVLAKKSIPTAKTPKRKHHSPFEDREIAR
ncbi:MATE family efflux transporter [Candidatus Borkfalkia ceftriaxoniphila]|uniref:MATE family efflux transporter n=1 Tax=Candidatus Borkfalkia ceftriaxoniphila TaxID=2508949 RepID=A0A4Q2KGG1_9FIRM|nr:MATE family efflux transporter [Candidatus Borkfalkia ceftriaxoniphila]RXZ62412.1 MATE family efflux transporter [Candidatus Borkfalkia ceftriaxoniphila]